MVLPSDGVIERTHPSGSWDATYIQGNKSVQIRYTWALKRVFEPRIELGTFSVLD